MLFRKEDETQPTTNVNVQSDQGQIPGRSGYDVLTDFVKWMKSAIKWIVLGLIVVLSYLFVGWYASLSIILGMIFWYVILNYIVQDQGAVYVDEVKDGRFYTWTIGQDRWAEYQFKGLPFHFMSSSGKPRYIAEEFSEKDGVVKFAWIHELSSWKFLTTWKAHKALLEVLEKALPENVKLRLYPRILGYIEAQAALDPIGEIMDEERLSCNPEPETWIKKRETADQALNFGIDEIIDKVDKKEMTNEKTKDGDKNDGH